MKFGDIVDKIYRYNRRKYDLIGTSIANFAMVEVRNLT